MPDVVLEKAGIVSPNETEALVLTGVHIETVDDARRAGRVLLERGARRAVLKLGGAGALYMDGNEWVHAPAFPILPMDTTAAGDAFTAALALVWRDRPPTEALEFANAAGALAATAAGAQPSMPTRAAVEAFLKERR